MQMITYITDKDMVYYMIYLLENTDLLDEDFLFRAIPLLSLQRKQKLDLLAMNSGKISSAAVFLLLRYALCREYGITEPPELRIEQNGKPYLSERDDIFLNLSHSRNSCVCIISEKETAVDITDKRRISMATAKHFCSRNELDSLVNTADSNTELVRLWSQKECYSKLSGKGLSLDFKNIGPEQYRNIHCIDTPRYVLAYYSEKEETINTVNAADLLSL